MLIALDVILRPSLEMRIAGLLLPILGIAVVGLTCILIFKYFKKRREENKMLDVSDKEEKED